MSGEIWRVGKNLFLQGSCHGGEIKDTYVTCCVASELKESLGDMAWFHPFYCKTTAEDGVARCFVIQGNSILTAGAGMCMLYYICYTIEVIGFNNEKGGMLSPLVDQHVYASRYLCAVMASRCSRFKNIGWPLFQIITSQIVFPTHTHSMLFPTHTLTFNTFSTQNHFNMIIITFDYLREDVSWSEMFVLVK